MTIRSLLLRASLAAGLTLAAAPAHAQLAVGGNIGWLFDTEEDRFSIGADGRYTLANKRWILNPRITKYLLSEGASAWQLDANLLYDIPVEASFKVKPYAGLGLAFVNSSFETTAGDESDSKVGVNWIAGAALRTTGKLTPWLHFTYTAAMDYGNTFVGFAGLSYAIGR
ncbi:MAG: outer membrane beta-barrel protein [Cytophagaceae bacterium]|nr:outer membrane beta-barrel protein [Gemmatimonadaceae bacterium]